MTEFFFNFKDLTNILGYKAYSLKLFTGRIGAKTQGTKLNLVVPQNIFHMSKKIPQNLDLIEEVEKSGKYKISDPATTKYIFENIGKAIGVTVGGTIALGLAIAFSFVILIWLSPSMRRGGGNGDLATESTNVAAVAAEPSTNVVTPLQINIPSTISIGDDKLPELSKFGYDVVETRFSKWVEYYGKDLSGNYINNFNENLKKFLEKYIVIVDDSRKMTINGLESIKDENVKKQLNDFQTKFNNIVINCCVIVEINSAGSNKFLSCCIYDRQKNIKQCYYLN